MMNFKSEFLQELQSRGFIAQITHEKELDDTLFAAEKSYESGAESLQNVERFSAYIGFDCTASSLHVGSLIQIMILRLLQKHGHAPIILLGGGTTKIGDPSGKDEARQILTEEKIQQNLSGIKNTLAQFIDFDDNFNDKLKSASKNTSKGLPNKAGATIVNNDDWLKKLNYIEFLRDVGKHFSVNRMLSFDSVKLRLERDQPLSFLEFNYMILQAYDFYELNLQHGCRLQIGGSDQWGNIVNGVELTRRKSATESQKKLQELEKRVFEEKLGVNAEKYFVELSRYFQELELIQDKKQALNFHEKFIEKIKTIPLTEKENLITKRLEKEIFEFDKNVKKNRSVFGLTSPLLTTADGKKMGKTADGAVWLDANMLAPFDYFQYFRNTHDADVIKFLKLFTDLPLTENEKTLSEKADKNFFSIDELEKLEGQEINRAKEILAFEVTKICHGEKSAQEALQKAREIFIAKSSAAYETKEIEIGEGKKLIEIIKEIGAVESNAEAKRLIEGRGIKVNDQAVADIGHFIKDPQEFTLSVGKKKFFKIIAK